MSPTDTTYKPHKLDRAEYIPFPESELPTFKKMKFNTRGNPNINVKILSLLYKFGYKWPDTDNLKMLEHIRNGSKQVVFIFTHEDGGLRYSENLSTFKVRDKHQEIDLTDILKSDKGN